MGILGMFLLATVSEKLSHALNGAFKTLTSLTSNLHESFSSFAIS